MPSRRKGNVRRESGHCFSIELKSKEFLRNLTISNRTGETVLLEGLLGELEEMSLVEGAMLEVRGSNGVLRMDVSEEDWERLLARVAPRIVKKVGKNENHSAGYREVEQSPAISDDMNGDLR